jgi:N-acetylmuramic acid 6-phosphate etherase
VDDVVAASCKGGRLFYIGAGTSGRLGVLDASECPPTYGVPPTMVQGLIAGGQEALTTLDRRREDDAEAGVSELERLGFRTRRCPRGHHGVGAGAFVLGAMARAQELGAAEVAAISCNRGSKTFNLARHVIYLDVGPEWSRAPRG